MSSKVRGACLFRLQASPEFKGIKTLTISKADTVGGMVRVEVRRA